MDDTASDYHHGEQNIAEQVATYQSFGGMAKWGSLILAVLLTMCILWFCTAAGFAAGLISGLVLLVLGVVFLRASPAAEH